MRSSKSRSRSKNNRNRSVGNIVNRVFDSSGPEGKVRGTPQQIIDKYKQLARDALLANDRVAVENFQQHAEHYTRMLKEGQREMEARREQQDREHRERQKAREEQRAEQVAAEKSDQPEVFESGTESGLVETPENSKPRKPRSRSRSRKNESEAADVASSPQPDAAGDPSEAAE